MLQSAPSSAVSAFLSLGSNLGDRLFHLQSAFELLAQKEGLRVVALSPIYETSPVGGVPQSYFLNCCVHIQTTLSPEALLQEMQEIENRLHRKRFLRFGPRSMDVDILLYDRIESREPHLTLPHPRMFERAFVLVPLQDIYPKDGPYAADIEQALRRGAEGDVQLYAPAQAD